MDDWTESWTASVEWKGFAGGCLALGALAGRLGEVARTIKSLRKEKQ